jgi:uncharacterized protein YndB with AHSA1/START domain
MTRIVTVATIRRPPAVVFDFVTTPGHWPEWHPSSLSVTGATDHSLDVGEQCTEHFRVAGREGTVVWTVAEREAPNRWVIRGNIAGGGGGTITYTLMPEDAGTRFMREFVYAVPNPLLALLDLLVVRRRITAESAEALRRLKARLEASN